MDADLRRLVRPQGYDRNEIRAIMNRTRDVQIVSRHLRLIQEALNKVTDAGSGGRKRTRCLVLTVVG